MNTEKLNVALSPVETSRLLVQLKQEILARWEKRACANVQAAQAQSRRGLIDSLPRFIDQLVETLGCSEPVSESDKTSDIAKGHGEHRASQLEYSLEEVIFEYHLLRAVTIETLTAENSIDNDSLSAIHKFLDFGILKAAAKFAKLHELREASLKADRDNDRKQLTAAIEVAKVGFFDWNMQKDYFEVNEHFSNDWGVGNGATISDILGIMHPEDRGPTQILIEDAMKTGAPYLAQYRIQRRPDGKLSWIEARGRANRDELGNLTSFFGTTINFTERKNAEAELAFERHKLKTIVANSTASIAVLRGENFIYEITNKSYSELFNNREFVGRPLLEALPELSDQPFPRHAKSVFETGVPYIEVEARALLKRTEDGPLEERYFDQTYSRILDQKNEPYGIFMHAQEVTDRVSARKALATERRKLDLIIKEAPIGIALLKGPDLKFEIANQQWQQLVPNHREYIGQTYDYVYPELVSTGLSKAIQEVFESGRTFNAYEMLVPVANSAGVLEDRFYDFSYVRITDANNVPYGVFSVASNATQRVIAQRELSQAKLEAERANLAKSAFLANMSHEIRTPLGAIMGFAELARDPDATPADVASYLGIVERNSVQVMRIIDDILDLAKVEAGRVELEKMEFSLTAFLADFTSLLGFRARESGISFNITAKTDLPEIIVSDPTRLRQILTNSVGNAIKFTSRGFVSIHVFFTHGVLRFEVEDTGRGISKAQSQSLFQAFAQADASTTRKFGGTGLGLVLTKRLCQLMGGDYILERSELGKGSTFKATIKVELPASARILKQSEVAFERQVEKNSALRLPGKLEGVLILLVEDSPDNQVLIRLILERQGAKLDIASDGLVGVEMAMSEKYDLVLMDIQMPVMDGHEAARLLRSRGYSRPVIALTAHAMREEEERAFQSGFNNFLTKPINREALIAMVSGLIEKKNR